MSTERRKALVSTPFIWGILVFLLFAVIALVWFRLPARVQTYDDKRAVLRREKLRKLRVDDAQKLGGFAWADAKKSAVQIPISRAEELELAELKLKLVQATAINVENPYPAGLQQPPAPAATQEVRK